MAALLSENSNLFAVNSLSRIDFCRACPPLLFKPTDLASILVSCGIRIEKGCKVRANSES